MNIEECRSEMTPWLEFVLKYFTKKETDETRVDRLGRSFEEPGLKQVKADVFIR